MFDQVRMRGSGEVVVEVGFGGIRLLTGAWSFGRVERSNRVANREYGCCDQSLL